VWAPSRRVFELTRFDLHFRGIQTTTNWIVEPEPECMMGEQTTRPLGADLPVATLLNEMARDLSTLVRQEIELAKVETKQEVAKAGQAGGALGVAGLAGWLFVIFVSLAAMFGIGALIPLGWAALIVAGVWAIIGGACAAFGIRRLRSVRPVPTQTIQTVKEDVRWIRNRNG
jgi:Putative Actinobacterial Holin-X, holin superfamily III